MYSEEWKSQLSVNESCLTWRAGLPETWPTQQLQVEIQLWKRVSIAWVYLEKEFAH